MANLISNGIDPKAGTNLADTVGDAIDKGGHTDEDHAAFEHEMQRAQMQYQLEYAKLDLEDKKAVMEDVADARNNQTLVQQSDHASWLAKNIQPLLSIFIIGITFYLFWYILFGSDPSQLAKEGTKDIVIYILGALTTISAQVVSYFFGSSHGSAEKTKSLNAVLNKQP
ncbi:MAG: hypothetical protein AB3X41_07800 [Leptothrix ochracea]|uniref:hypothetical protein n=1 Tax=Leptothrix ochracea TaxID=735331 RepID=UPI0034E2D21F